MKAWKFLVLAGGIAGLIGFFLPFTKGHEERTNLDISFSGYQLVKGIDSIKDAVKEVAADAKKVETSRAVDESLAKEMEEGMSAVRGFALIAYAPAALLAIMGAFALVLRRFGRLGGVFAFLLGAVSAGIWGLLWAAAGEARHEGTTLSLQMGAHMLLVAGIAGLVAGLGALVVPDKG
jgi:hypothetical protein